MNHFLSKSLFLRGLQCRKSLWLSKFRPDLRAEAGEAQKAAMAAGEEVGLVARGLFPGGDEIVYEGNSPEERVERTRSLIDGGAHTIYEATFRFGKLLVMVDILHRGEGGWELYEVKMSTEVKPVYLSDVAFQYYVVTRSGLPVVKASVVHIDKDYVRRGDIDVNALFQIEDVTERSTGLEAMVNEELGFMLDILERDCPEIGIGPQCRDPYECDFIPYCWAGIPENSVFDLRGKGIDKFASYRQGKVLFSDLNPAELNFKQGMQVSAELQGREYVDRDGIRAFLDSLYYPLCFLDFETLYNEAIPPFDGTRPYSRIPFQYSIHILESEGEELIHHEFLAPSGADCREELAERLVEIIPDRACVLAYNMSFEKGVISELAEEFPRLKDKLLMINDHMKDLMVPFRERFCYTKEMKGSYSIKYVLPALVPDLRYEGMVVSNGDEAVLAYKRLAAMKNAGEAAALKKDLLAYCRLDTLAMVRLLEKLRKLSR